MSAPQLAAALFDFHSGQGLRQFTRKDAVRGLTAAATIWLTCAIGMACGGGLPLLALGATAVHSLVVRGFSKVSDLISSRPSFARIELRISYHSQQGLLGRMLEICTGSGFRVTDVQVETGTDRAGAPAEVLLRLEGPASAHPLVETLSEPAGVRGVALGRQDDSTE